LGDILAARDGLALRSTANMGWNADQQRMVIVETARQTQTSWPSGPPGWPGPR
jgi:hypothetical protein